MLQLKPTIRMLAMCSIPTIATAQENRIEAVQDESWEMIPGNRSADWASAQWELVSSTSIDSGDVGFGIVTFWAGQIPQDSIGDRNVRAIFRCVDWFDASGVATGGVCYQPQKGFGGAQ
jgi:hypothetical protein